VSFLSGNAVAHKQTINQAISFPASSRVSSGR